MLSNVIEKTNKSITEEITDYLYFFSCEGVKCIVFISFP